MTSGLHRGSEFAPTKNHASTFIMKTTRKIKIPWRMYFIDKMDGSYHSSLNQRITCLNVFLHLNTCVRARNLRLIFLFILLILLTLINPISQSCLLLFKLLDCLQGFQTQRSCTSLYYRMHKVVRDSHWQYRSIDDDLLAVHIGEGSITSPHLPRLAPSKRQKTVQGKDNQGRCSANMKPVCAH